MPTAQVVTLTEQKHTSVKRVYWDWLSTDAGVVLSPTTKAYDGLIERAVFTPDNPGGGGTQPTNAYDVTITDADGVDVLAGLGADLANNATVVKTHANGLTAVAGSVLTLNVANAGNAKGGIVILYLR
jgi:hypothetical protein